MSIRKASDPDYKSFQVFPSLSKSLQAHLSAMLNRLKRSGRTKIGFLGFIDNAQCLQSNCRDTCTVCIYPAHLERFSPEFVRLSSSSHSTDLQLLKFSTTVPNGKFAADNEPLESLFKEIKMHKKFN